MARTTSSIGGIPNIVAAAHFLATSPVFAETAVFVVVEEARQQLQLAQLLPLFFQNTRPVQTLTHSTLDRAFALATMRQAPTITIVTREIITTHDFPSREKFQQQSFMVTHGNNIPLATIKTFLGENGYDRETIATRPGTFSVHGGVCDIVTDAHYRIIFENNAIGRITKNANIKVPSVALPPLQLAGRSSWEEYCNSDIAIVLWDMELTSTKIVTALHVLPTEKTNADYQTPKAYHRRFDLALRDVGKKKFTVLTTHPEEIQAVFPAATIIATVPENVVVASGFVLPSHNCVVLTDRDLGFEPSRLQAQRKRAQRVFFQAIQKEDYVVHYHHGIARCGGLTRMHINDRDREYMILHYAGNDKIYLPVENVDRLDKYVGPANPTLHGLQEARWQDTMRKVRDHALVFARDLLNCAASRMLATAHPLRALPAEEQTCAAQFPFDLTVDQERALAEIFYDLGQATPMDRVLVGDVGFGKTELALRTAFRAALNNVQVAVLCPTTILTQQHVDTFRDRLEQFGVAVALLSRWATQHEQQKILHSLETGTIDIVIGTHRLLSRDVAFKNLGVIIIDEEQRFGVKAKEQLKQLRSSAHVLTMTATPIPRTLALTLAEVRNISTMTTPPSNRQPTTITITRHSDALIQKAIQQEMQRKGQTYYVENRIPLLLQRQRKLQQLLPASRIGIAHGQMPPEELATVMHQFDGGELDVLLATTIIENGLDIPAANTLIVEGASHFGLAELYQLKGRIGRSALSSFAYFFYNEDTLSPDASERLRTLQDAQKLGAGFELAMKDMQLRGVGSVLGKEQHGHADAVGLNLYLRLVQYALAELQRGEAEFSLERDIPIDLPLNVQIPATILAAEGDRIRCYQEIAAITDVRELTQEKERRMEQWGVPPDSSDAQALAALFDLLEIKILSRQALLVGIYTTFPSAHNRLTSPRITLTSKVPLPGLPTPWEQTAPTKARATLAELGDQWMDNLKNLLIAVHIL